MLSKKMQLAAVDALPAVRLPGDFGLLKYEGARSID